MRVKAVKVEDGFLIPFNDVFKQVKSDTIVIEVEIIEPDTLDEGYALLDELVGFVASDRSDTSVNHDAILYGQQEP